MSGGWPCSLAFQTPNRRQTRALWPLLLASLGDRRAPAAVDELRRLGAGAIHLNRGMIGYADAVLAGRGGDGRRAEEVAAKADVGFVNCENWAVLSRFLAAPAARSDRWGSPERWLVEAAEVFPALGLDGLAARARQLLKAGAPNPWADEGITGHEADVLRLVADGLANKEIADKAGGFPTDRREACREPVAQDGRKDPARFGSPALQAKSTTT